MPAVAYSASSRCASGEVARHVSDRVSDAVLRDDPQRLNAEIENFKRDDTVLGVVLRDTAGNEI